MTEMRIPEVGETAPDFRLRGPDGQIVTLSEFRGVNPVVLAFFPLAFSPVCSHQLPDIEGRMGRLRARHAEVLGISVDSHHANREFGNRLRLTFPLLSDLRREASRAYGVMLEKHAYSNRALFLVDLDGRIAYRDISPDPDVVPSIERVIAELGKLAI